MVARAFAFCIIFVIGACGESAGEPKVEGGMSVGWEVVEPSVPKRLDVPVVEGGIVLNSYRDGDRVTVTLVYGSVDRGRLETVYDEWSEEQGGVKSGRGFDVQGRVAWQDSWRADRSEARMSECLNELSGEFDNLCVALTTWVGSVP